jgi:hypothetical protein
MDMGKEEIEALEPKYTGNQRKLTEGEAAAIKADPSYEDNDLADGLENIPAAGALGIGLGFKNRT